jgi:hypothetical protein
MITSHYRAVGIYPLLPAGQIKRLKLTIIPRFIDALSPREEEKHQIEVLIREFHVAVHLSKWMAYPSGKMYSTHLCQKCVCGGGGGCWPVFFCGFGGGKKTG